MEDAGQLAYLRASVRECGFDKKCVQIPPDEGHLTGLLTFDSSGLLKQHGSSSNLCSHQPRYPLSMSNFIDPHKRVFLMMFH